MSLPINEVAQAVEVSRETLRYYERRGLIAAPDRSPGGHRLYDERAVQTLRVIRLPNGSASHWRRWPTCSRSASVAGAWHSTDSSQTATT